VTGLPRSRGSQLYLVQLIGVAVGLALVAFGPWRAGVTTIGVTFLVGAVGRAVVPDDHTGMLRVRGKAFDIAWTTAIGVGLIILAAVIPNQAAR